MGRVRLERISKSERERKKSKSTTAKQASARTLSNARRAKPNANIIGRLRFESFLLELSAYFAKAPADCVNRGIDAWLEKLAGFIGVDRISLWECDPDGVKMHRQHVYSRQVTNIRSPIVLSTDFPWTSEQYRQGKFISWERVPEDVPTAAAAELTHTMRVGAKSVLGIPLQTGEAVYVLSCASIRAYRKWPIDLVRRMQLVGEIFASALIRQRTERSLLASESRNRALLKALPDLIFVLNSEGVYVECHCPQAVDLYVPPEQFMGRTMEEVMPSDVAKTFRTLFQLACETGGVVEHEYVLSIAGEERHFEARMVRRDDGAIVAIVRNISERHRAANKLRESEARFRVAFSHSAIGVALVSLEGDWLQVNAALCRILGYSESELLLSTHQALVHPEDLEATRTNLQRALAGQSSHYEMENRYVHKDGRIIRTLLTIALVGNELNEPLYFVFQLQDVTERRQSQIEIERARLELAHIGRVALVGQLTSSLAHELLQPITAVVSNAEAGLHAPDLDATSEMHAVLQDIADSGRQAGEIIQHVRALLRKERPPYMAVDLNRLVQEVARVMRSDLVLHQVQLTTELDSSNAEINGDRGEMQQVLLNLVLNGIEAMHAVPIPERQLRIATIVRSDSVELNVQDKGSGSPPASMERLLEPFFTTKADGVGMGLSICADIVRAHRGQLLAENNADKGMTWRCILPRRETAPTGD
jgi:PAS domain S-box-containing protein